MTSQTHSDLLEADEVDEIDQTDDAQPAEPSLLPRLAAELFGTFVLVTAIVVVAGFGALGVQGTTALHVALAGGLALTAMVAAFGSLSGAHLNPAVSIGAAIAGRLSWADLVPYVVAQTIGAVLAGGFLRAIVPAALPGAIGAADARAFLSTTANGFGTHSPIAGLSGGAVTFSTAQALLVEGVATAILVGVVLAVTRKPNPAAPLAIGGTLTVAILVAAQVTNAAINPARATGTALFADGWAIEQLWLFWVAPLLGGVLAGLLAFMIDTGSAPAPVAEDWDDEESDDEELGNETAEELDDDSDLAPESTAAEPAAPESDEDDDEADPDRSNES